jgi:hypothetical protein
MSAGFTVPEEFQQSFRRLLPYMTSPLRNDEKALEAILIYLKLGDEKLARVAIEAMNENQRLNDAALKKKLREEALLRERDEDDDEDEEDAEDAEVVDQPDED